MRRVLVLALLGFFTTIVSGQTPRIDILKRGFYSAGSDAGRLRALLTLLEQDETLPKDTLWDYARKAQVLARALGDGPGLSLAVLGEAKAYLRWDNTDSARILVETELAKYKASDAENRDLYFRLARSKIDCMGNSNNYKDGMEQVYHLIREAEMYKDSAVISECMNSLAAWNYDMDFVDIARKWSYNALSYTSAAPRYFSVRTGIYLNLAENYRWIGQLDSADYCAEKAIDYSRRMENLFYLSVGLQKKAAIEIERKEYAAAEQAILESIQIIEKVEGRAPQQEKLLVLASVYRHSGQVDKAISVLNEGLVSDSIYRRTSPHRKISADTGDLRKVFYYELLAKCYKQKGDSKNYEAILEKIIDGKDEFYKANSASAIAELETRYEFQKKEAMIAQQRLALLKDEYLFYASLVFALLGSIIVWLLFKNVRRKQSLNMQRLQEEEKRLAAQAVATAEETERRRIAADLHDNLGAQLSFIRRNVNFILDQPGGFSAEDERKYLGFVNDTAQNAMIDLRETIWVLNKDEVDIQEFADKLKSYLRQQLHSKDRIRWNFTEDIRGGWKLSSGEVMHLFRVVQELVSNVIKHSGADLIEISLAASGTGAYRLTISDNGRGFDVNGRYESHYGMETIRQRAREIGARLSFESGLQTGTTVVLEKGNNTFELLQDLSDNTNIAD
ncbi:MAG: sensor histidine kinase [Puia sp.]|nr:sensor histidine kinase [Puia sp.]